jgi:polar amino acid transport system substrate-binding protein
MRVPTFRRCKTAGCVLALIALAGCGSDSDENGASESGAQETSNAPANLVKDGSLTVCTDPSYPPLEYYGQAKELDGFDIAVARAAADKLGLEAAFKPTTFSGILPALDSGRCDLAWSGLFIDDERTASFGAVPYQKTASVILVKAGNPAGIHSPDDLSGKTVASQNGSNLLKKAKKISQGFADAGTPPSNVQGYDKFEEAIQQLVVGRADAVITQDIDAAFRALKQPGQFETAYKFPDTETFGAYYKPENAADLGNKLHAALQELQESGELAKIAEEEGMPADGIGVEQPVGG